MSKKITSNGYRFWRNFGSILASALVGGLVGFLSGNRSLKLLQQDLAGLTGDWIPILMIFLILGMCLSGYGAYRQLRRFRLLADMTEDEELALDYDAQANRQLNLVSFLVNGMLVPTFFLYAYLLSDPERMSGKLFFYICFLLDVGIVCLGFNLNKQAYRLVKGVSFPRYANTKEQKVFLLSRMDEVEKQIYCKGSFELFLKLTGQILPISLLGLLFLEVFSPGTLACLCFLSAVSISTCSFLTTVWANATISKGVHYVKPF